MIKEIYLSWRKGGGAKRHLVGVLKRINNKFSFDYLHSNIAEAKSEGFRHYPEFPDLSKNYTENIMEILSIRLIPQDRPDSLEYLKFWEADDPDLSPFDVLALTQGRAPTDNFEFLADFPFQKNFKFVTDLARLTYTQPQKDDISINDTLTYQFDDKSSEHDPFAVMVLKNGKEIGHIKKVHNRFLRNAIGGKPNLSVKAVNKNGTVKAVYILVES